MPAFPWSQLVLEARHTVFDVFPCDNQFEMAFARFLDNADDIAAFAKLPLRFGFSVEYLDEAKNLRLCHPDWVTVDQTGTHHLIETKGVEGAEVRHKDHAAAQWCQNATALTGTPWVYRKVRQKDFESLAPETLSDLAALSG